MTQFLLGFQTLINRLLEIYQMALLIYFLLSWLPGARESSLGRFLERICEPYVGFFRQFIPPIGMISLAGMVAYVSLSIIERGFNVLFLMILRFVS